eukprot:COSAG01_NODE_206_length_22034_cov_125.512585_10_plen_795_part_00
MSRTPLPSHHGPSPFATAPPSTRLRFPGAHRCSFDNMATSPSGNGAVANSSKGTYHSLPAGLDDSVEVGKTARGPGAVRAKLKAPSALTMSRDWEQKGHQLRTEQLSKHTAEADRIFAEVDKDRKGYLTSAQVEVATRKLNLPRLNGSDSCNQWFVQMLELSRTPSLIRLHGEAHGGAQALDGLHGRILHVRGVGQGRQDQSGMGPYENDNALRAAFSEFGPVQSVKIRHRQADGKNTSWALITMQDASSAAAVLSKPQVTIGEYPLKVTPFSKSVADRSTGAMASNTWRAHLANLHNHVSRTAFLSWVKLYHDKLKQLTLQSVDKLFKVLDADGSGALDQSEVKLLALALRQQFRWLTLDPPFESERDFELMLQFGENPPGAPQEVSLDVFKAWWKLRLGVDEPSMSILPEYMVKTIDEELCDGVLQQQQAPRRDGRSLWNFLRPRLISLVRIQAVWGRLPDIYSHTDRLHTDYESVNDAVFLPPYIYHPEGKLARRWDVLLILVMAWVAYWVPLQVCFTVHAPKPGSFLWIVELFVNLIFAVDIVLRFRTAYYNQGTGVLVYRPAAISRHYLRTGFILDFASTVPSVIFDYCILVHHEGNNMALELKLFRLFRLSRMLRLTRVTKLMHERGLRAASVNAYVHTAFTLLGIFFVAHMLACFWFFIGGLDEVFPDGTVVRGWTHNPENGFAWTSRADQRWTGLSTDSVRRLSTTSRTADSKAAITKRQTAQTTAFANFTSSTPHLSTTYWASMYHPTTCFCQMSVSTVTHSLDPMLRITYMYECMYGPMYVGLC